MNFTVIKAIFKRDFVSYFSNPTGYVFICVFVVLSSLAAFWPPDFFGNNLANLDQLNKWLPFIMLVFIPAITMSIWAEERRQGTDELLLTLPASDFDVVLGKYLASVAIYTVSLLFSMFSIYLVFSWGLGSPDPGLFIGTYVGYWFIGLAMLAIGMVASFLTNNLTVGFTLGMVFNLPLAMFGVADWIIKDPQVAQSFKRWSAIEQFSDFQRGVISLAGISYFVLIAVVMLYVSMVLISRRHWASREDGQSMWAHYTLRALALGAIVVGLNLAFANKSTLHVDVTSQKLNSLAGRTKELVEDLRDNPDIKTIHIDAYVSPQVPAEYAAHKLNLLSTLQELSALSGGKIVVSVHEIENFSEAAALAEQTYGIEPREVSTLNRGARGTEEIFLGVAITAGLDKVVIPFVDRGIPIEYELIRSICTVAQQERKKLGVVKTDVPLMGGFSMQGPSEESQLITELRKQYDVVEVDPARPIEKKYDVLLAIQPSSLTPEAMQNFVQAIKDGIPTAIFEDPFPLPQFWGNVVGTAQPKMPPGGMMAMFSGGAQPEPKGDINQLWNLLGVEMHGDEIIWQDYNPEPKAGDFVDLEWIFIDDGLKAHGVSNPFSQEDTITATDPNDPNSAGMQQLLLLVSGSLKPENNTKLKFTELAVTGTQSGTINYRDYETWLRSGGAMAPRRALTRVPYIVAAHVEGKVPDDEDLFVGEGDEKDKTKAEAAKEDSAATKDESAKSDDLADPAEMASGESTKPKGPKEHDINVVVVTDIDWIAPIIFQLREMGQNQDMLIDWKFQNVPFVLNVLDSLAGDDRFVDIRKRTRSHRILTKVEEATEEFRTKSLAEQHKFINDATQEIEAVRQNFRDKLAELEKRTDLDPRMKAQVLEMQRIDYDRQRDVQIARLEKQRDKQIKQSERDLALKIRGVQDWYKFAAVVLPPIPPILLAFFVYFHRRKAEQEGVDARRLRWGKKTKDTDKDAA
jgi:ABC-2 type transport system permease protein